MRVVEICKAVLGGVIFALSVAWIAAPVGLVTGGVSGVGIVLKELFEIPIFLTGLILNIPLFVVCIVQRGWQFIVKSLIAFVSLTLALSAFEGANSPLDFENDLLMSTVLYGIVSGVGLGLVLQSGATSGGTDMLAAIIKYKKPDVAISELLLTIDVAVIAFGAFVFGLRYSLYAIIAVFISVRVIDIMLSGFGIKKSVFIISDKGNEISSLISSRLKRGVTGISSVGMYTNEKRRMLLTVVSSRELNEVRLIVGECDENAFVTIWDTKQVLGKGFNDINISKGSLS